jgi:hypothetical protein
MNKIVDIDTIEQTQHYTSLSDIQPNTPQPNTPQPNTQQPNTPQPNTPQPNTPLPPTKLKNIQENIKESDKGAKENK